MLLGALKFDLFVHCAIAITIAVLLTIRYSEQSNVTTFDWNHTLSGTTSIISIVNAVISFLNLAKDVLIDDDKCDGKPKKRLKNGIWNFGRNTFTSLSMVLICFLYGYASDNEDVLAPLILVGILRLSDVTLDVNSIIEVQCTSKELSENRTYRTAFAALAMIAALILYIIYVVEHPFQWDGDNTGDEIALTIGISFLSLHLLLILLHLVLNQVQDIKERAVKWLKSDQSGNCDGVGIHMPNEIPIISKVVFTAVIGSLSIVVGERIEENVDITLLIWILCLVGATEMGGRNIL